MSIEICKEALIPQEEFVNSIYDAKRFALSLISREKWEKFRAGGDIGLNIPIVGDWISGTGSYEQYEERFEKEFQMSISEARKIVKIDTAKKWTTDKQLSAFSLCIQDHLKQFGLKTEVKFATQDFVTGIISWRPPAGLAFSEIVLEIFTVGEGNLSIIFPVNKLSAAGNGYVSFSIERSALRKSGFAIQVSSKAVGHDTSGYDPEPVQIESVPEAPEILPIKVDINTFNSGKGQLVNLRNHKIYGEMAICDDNPRLSGGPTIGDHEERRLICNFTNQGDDGRVDIYVEYANMESRRKPSLKIDNLKVGELNALSTGWTDKESIQHRVATQVPILKGEHVLEISCFGPFVSLFKIEFVPLTRSLISTVENEISLGGEVKKKDVFLETFD